MDKGIKKYDPHAIADAKMNAMINHKEAKRMLKKLTRRLGLKIFMGNSANVYSSIISFAFSLFISSPLFVAIY